MLCIVRGVATGPPSALSPSDADRFDVGMASAGATLLLLAGAMVLLVYSSRRSIRVAAACVSEAAAAVSAGGLPLLALPAIKTLLCLVVTALCVCEATPSIAPLLADCPRVWLRHSFMTATVYLMAAGEVVPGRWVSVPGISGPVQTRTVRWNSTLRACFLLQAFGWVWAVGALWAAGDFVVAYAVSSWYFHTTDAQQTDSGVRACGSACRPAPALTSTVPHLGAPRRAGVPSSVAWHARGWPLPCGILCAGRAAAGFVVVGAAAGGVPAAPAAVSRGHAPRVARAPRLRSGESLAAARIATRATHTHTHLAASPRRPQTCLSCMQAQLRFVQSHAYVHMAIFGASFCRSARSAFHLLARHAGALGALYGISTVLRIIGCSLVCCVPTLAVYVALTANGAAAEVYSPVLPVLVGAQGARPRRCDAPHAACPRRTATADSRWGARSGRAVPRCGRLLHAGAGHLRGSGAAVLCHRLRRAWRATHGQRAAGQVRCEGVAALATRRARSRTACGQCAQARRRHAAAVRQLSCELATHAYNATRRSAAQHAKRTDATTLCSVVIFTWQSSRT